VIRFFAQLILYRKGLKSGYILETVQNGQSIWCIKPNAAKEIQGLGSD
jgi:hypothetical protein